MNMAALGINGYSWGLVRDEAELARSLGGLDGDKWHSLVLWRIPRGLQFEDSDPSEEAREFLQCAGSSSRMTIELRRLESDEFVRYTVGRNAATPYDPTGPTAVVQWHQHRAHVHDHEVFDSDSALPIFLSYLRQGVVDPGLTLRAAER